MNTFKTLLLTFVVVLAMPATAAEHVLKIATVSPEGSYWMETMRAGAAEISQRTEGRVELKFYGGGVMGNDKKVFRKMRIGQLHGGTFTSGGLSDHAPNAQLYGLPMLLSEQAEVDFIRERMDEQLIARLEDAGFVSSGFAGGGFAKLMSNEPLRSLDDLRGKKVWVPEGDTISAAALESLGLAPVTLPITDVLTGLQTGLIDIIGSSAVAAVVLQWHTKVKYVSDLPVTYIYATLVIDDRAFGKLDAADQAVVREVLTATYKELDRVNRDDEIKAMAALEKAGIEVIEIDPAQVPQW
ncbi:MAG: TRAP transporter substrate-binding protein DctP, partial [Gammaproteobacteria bacterium]|nr:TRAP transporter substrate-binding protein DctP [Gammaproteobacteria bacterium]